MIRVVHPLMLRRSVNKPVSDITSAASQSRLCFCSLCATEALTNRCDSSYSPILPRLFVLMMDHDGLTSPPKSLL